MNKDQFISFIDNPSLIDNQSSKELQQLVDQYPYFQSARILFLKSLYDNKSIAYQSELKLTATYAGNRALLQAFITRKQAPVIVPEVIVPEIKEEPKPIEIVVQEEPKEIIVEQQTEAEIPVSETNKPNIRTTIVFDFEKEPETLSSFELPKITEEAKEPVTEKKKQQLEIIERFIKTEPRIVPKENAFDQSLDLSAESTADTEFMTETLAEIYVRQKKYDKAIAMFQKLSLKFPQKSIYFATRISDVNNIVNQDKK